MQVGEFLRHELEGPGLAESDTLRVPATQFAFHDLSSVLVIGNGAEWADRHAGSAAHALVVVNVNSPCLPVLLDGEGGAKHKAEGLVAMLTADHVKDEVILLIDSSDRMGLVPQDLNPGL